MKKPYAESTLKRKYRKTGLPKEVLEKLHFYFSACVNFYKVISVNEVWEIIQETERCQGKMDIEDILNPEMLECAHNYALEEFQRNFEDTFTFDGIDFGNIDIQGREKLTKRLEQFLLGGVNGYKGLLFSILVPLTSNGFSYDTESYTLSREDYDKVIAIKERSCDRYFVLPESDFYEDGKDDILYLVDIPTIAEFEDGELVGMSLDPVCDILDRSYEKPLYIPKDLLCYIDSTYFESTPEVKAMERFLRKSFFAGRKVGDEDTDAEIELLLFEMNYIITQVKDSPTSDIQKVTQMLEERGYLFDGSIQFQKFLQLYMDMSNSTRLPVNKGYTPQQLRPAHGRIPEKITFGPGIQKLLQSGEWDPEEMKRSIMTTSEIPIELRGDMMREVDKALEPGEERVINAGGTIVKGKKIKPNDPCPCGSGRKYKHCCGRNQ